MLGAFALVSVRVLRPEDAMVIVAAISELTAKESSDIGDNEVLPERFEALLAPTDAGVLHKVPTCAVPLVRARDG